MKLANCSLRAEIRGDAHRSNGELCYCLVACWGNSQFLLDQYGGWAAFTLAPPATFNSPAEARAFAVLHGYETAPELTEGKVATVVKAFSLWFVLRGRQPASLWLLPAQVRTRSVLLGMFGSRAECVDYAERHGYRVVEGSAS